MTLSELEADLYRRLGYESSPATAVTTRLRAFLNQTQRDILSEPGMEVLLRRTASIVTVANQFSYTLPASMARITKVSDFTNRFALGELSLDAFRQLQPDVTTNTGIPTHYVDFGFVAATQPSDASDIFVDSTSASDTNTAFLEGFRTDGHPFALSVSMTGITAVSFKGANLITDIAEITKFYLSAAAVGEVTLHEDASGGTELAQITIGQKYSRYRRVALFPTPASAISLRFDYEYDPTDLANASDEPSLPPRFHPLLIDGALKREFQKKDDGRYVTAEREYERRLSQLRYFLFTHADHRPVMGGLRTGRPSQLGGWFPAGS